MNGRDVDEGVEDIVDPPPLPLMPLYIKLLFVLLVLLGDDRNKCGDDDDEKLLVLLLLLLLGLATGALHVWDDTIVVIANVVDVLANSIWLLACFWFEAGRQGIKAVGPVSS